MDLLQVHAQRFCIWDLSVLFCPDHTLFTTMPSVPGESRLVSGGRTQTGPGGAALPGDVEKKKARAFALLPCLKQAHGSKHLMVRSFWDRRDFLEGACHSPGHISREQRPPLGLSSWPCCCPWTMSLCGRPEPSDRA